MTIAEVDVATAEADIAPWHLVIRSQQDDARGLKVHTWGTDGDRRVGGVRTTQVKPGRAGVDAVRSILGVDDRGALPENKAESTP
jgi:hypothetical protein